MALTDKGAWNASTNSPDLVTGPAGNFTDGDWYTVSVAGTSIPFGSGISDWVEGDHLFFNGATSAFERFDALTASFSIETERQDMTVRGLSFGHEAGIVVRGMSADYPLQQDMRGLSVLIGFPPTCEITSPATGSSPVGTTITVSATVTDMDTPESAITLEVGWSPDGAEENIGNTVQSAVGGPFSIQYDTIGFVPGNGRIYVRAMDEDSWGPWTFVAYELYAPLTEPIITSPATDDPFLNDATITMIWEAASGGKIAQNLLRYRVEISTDNGASWSDVIALTDPNVLTWDIPMLGIPDSGIVWFRVSAYDGFNYGPHDSVRIRFYTSILSVTPDPVPTWTKGDVVTLSATFRDRDTSNDNVRVWFYWTHDGTEPELEYIGVSPWGGPHEIEWDTAFSSGGMNGQVWVRGEGR